MRITKRELFERLGVEVWDDLRESQYWLMVEEGLADITITCGLFRRDNTGRMKAEVMGNYYHDDKGRPGFRQCLFSLVFVECDADYVSLKNMVILGEEIDLFNRRLVSDGLRQFREGLGKIKAETRPVFVPPSEQEKRRNVLDDPPGILIDGGAGSRGMSWGR